MKERKDKNLKTQNKPVKVKLPSKPGKRTASVKGSDSVSACKPLEITDSSCTTHISNERWQDFIDSSAIWVWQTDAALRHVYTNAYVTRCLGYSPDEFLRMNTLDLLHSDDRALAVELAEKAKAHKEGWSGKVLRWRGRNGSWRYVESSGGAVFDKSGEFAGLFGIDRDITDRRQVEEALQESETRYRGFFENATVGVAIVDRSGHVVDANEADCRFLGYPRSELVGMHFTEFTHPDDLDLDVNLYQSLFDRKRDSYDIEKRYIRKDGAVVWGQLAVSMIRDSQGLPLYTVVVCTDITGRKLAEEALFRSEDRLRSLFEESPVSLWEEDISELQDYIRALRSSGVTDFRAYFRDHPDEVDKCAGFVDIISVNKASVDLFEADDQAMLIQGLSRIFTMESLESFRAILIAFAEGARQYECEAVNQTLKGRKIDVLLRWSLLAGYGEERTRALVSIVDITERKKLEQAQLLQVAMLNATPGFVGFADAKDTSILYINPAGRKMVGIQAQEDVTRLKIADVHPEWANRLLRDEIIPTALRDGVWTGECAFLNRDGREIPVLMVLLSHKSPKGEVERFSTVSIDITERKRAEEKLRQSEELFRTIIGTEPECVKIIDKDERLVMMNPAGLAMIEADSLDTVKGQKVYGLVTPAHREAFRQMVRNVLEGNTERFVFEIEGLKGTRRWLDSVSVPLRDASGEITALLGVTRDVTEKQKIEKELRESEGKYRDLVENANSLIVKCDAEGRVTFFNEYAQRFFGFTQDEILGRNLVGTIVPAEESSGRNLEQLMRDIFTDPDRYHDNENENVTKDGRRVWIRWANKAILNGAGNLEGLLSIGTDETERRKMYAMMRESEKRMSLAMAVSRQGFFEIDVRTSGLVVNPEFCRMMGYEPDEYAGLHTKWHDVIHPDDRAAAVSAFEEYLTGRRDELRTEFRHQTKSGQWRWILAVGTITGWHHEGDPARMLGTFTDVTERRLAEERIRLSEQFRESMLETVDEGFIIIDRDYRILIANAAYCRQVGMDCEEVLGKQCYAVSHRTARPCYEEGEECAVRRVFETGEPCSEIHRHPDAEGNVIYVETKAFPLKDADGKVTSAIETINNITERYLLEEERLKTQKLEAIGTLAGGIAHDFNNLLQGVFGFVSMAKMTLDRKEKALEMLEQAERALHMSVNLTTQLLTFSKGGKPVKSRLQLGPIIENSVKFSLSGSRSDCRLDIAPDLLPVEADEGQISQVLQNIVLNADQAMPMGGTVMVGARNVRPSDSALPAALAKGNYIAITVADSGIGIPEKYLSRIFDPYFTTKEKGSGLGLATSFSIIKNHGGIIDVKSEVGRGSVFTVYLPAEVEGVEEMAAPPVSVYARKGRILLMDDEAMIRTVAGELIKALGHEVVLSKDGREAIDVYRKARESGRPFDIAILDLTIRGGMGGAEAVKGILEMNPDARVVVSSGYADSEVVSRYREWGFCATLSKPYSVTSLKAVLDELLK